MLSKRGIERVAGILFPVIAVLVLLSIFIPVEIETPVDEFQASLQDIADHQERNLVGLSFGLVANLLTIASAAMLYLTFRLHHRPLALLAAFWFLAAAAIFMVSDSAKLALDSLAQQFGGGQRPRLRHRRNRRACHGPSRGVHRTPRSYLHRTGGADLRLSHRADWSGVPGPGLARHTEWHIDATELAVPGERPRIYSGHSWRHRFSTLFAPDGHLAAGAGD